MRMTLKKLNDLAPIGKTETECHSYRNYKGHLIVFWPAALIYMATRD